MFLSTQRLLFLIFFLNLVKTLLYKNLRHLKKIYAFLKIKEFFRKYKCKF